MSESNELDDATQLSDRTVLSDKTVLSSGNTAQSAEATTNAAAPSTVKTVPGKTQPRKRHRGRQRGKEHSSAVRLISERRWD